MSSTSGGENHNAEPASSSSVETTQRSTTANTDNSTDSKVEKKNSPPPERQISVLLCDVCKAPVASYTDLLVKKDCTAWAAHVYSYEIDLFETGEVVWAYSATNPSANRFDLLRVNPIAHAGEEGHRGSSGEDHPYSLVEAPLTYCRSAYCAEHSFFEGYEWCFCSCINCGTFLGWGFAHKDRLEALRRQKNPPTEATEQEKDTPPVVDVLPTEVTPDFLGVIVTKCTGDSEYSAQLFYDFVKTSKERDRRRKSIQNLRKNFVTTVRKLKNGLQGHQLYIAFHTAEMNEYGQPPDRLLSGENEDNDALDPPSPDSTTASDDSSPAESSDDGVVPPRRPSQEGNIQRRVSERYVGNNLLMINRVAEMALQEQQQQEEEQKKESPGRPMSETETPLEEETASSSRSDSPEDGNTAGTA